MRPRFLPATLAVFLLCGAPLSLAQAERSPAARLEADLRSLFSATGTLEIGEVSAALIRDRVSAEDIHFTGPEGQQLWLDRYVVSGDYDRPDEVRLEGPRLEISGREQTRLSAEQVVFDSPSRAVLPLQAERWPKDVTVAGLVVDALAVEFTGHDLGERWGEERWGKGRGRVDIERLEATGLSREAIDSLQLQGLAGQLQGEADAVSGTFSLAFARLEGLRGLQGDDDEQQLDRLELRDLAIDADRMVATLAGLEVDGDMADGEGGVRLEALDLDLARMIAMAPAEERTRLRMASNVLTGGSGKLRLDVDSLGRWEAGDGANRLLGEMHITAAEAFGWDLEADLPVRLPEGVEPAAFLADPENLEEVTLLGGRIDALLTDRGLFGRLAPLMAAGQGISEADFLAQARTQAKGFGMLLGPEIETLMTGLVDMMAGNASELAIHLSLPSESGVGGLTADPLALPTRLSMRVEIR